MKRLAALLLLSVSACGPLDLPLDPDLADTQAPTAVLELLDASGAVDTDGRVDVGEAFALSGARSTDIGGVVDRYEWLVPGLSPIRTDGPTLAVTEIDGVDFGTGVYTFGLRVSDDSGNQSALAETTVTVGDPDPPSAVLDVLDGVGALKPDGRIEAGDSFSLGGARSTDVGGSVVRYDWRLPGAVTVTTDAPTLAVTEIVDEGFGLGEHTFGLRVSDDSGNQSTLVETTVTIQDTRRPTAVLRILDALGEVDADGRIEVGQPFSLGGEGSLDSGGPIAQYEWRLPGGLTVSTDAPTLAVTEISDEGFGLGVHTFGLVVVDAAGNESVVVETTVTIVDTQAPTAVLQLRDAAGQLVDDGTIEGGSAFILDGSRSTDAGGRITSYEWIYPDGKTETTDVPSLLVTAVVSGGLDLGDYTFGLRVVDESGNESAVAQTTVTLVDTRAPTAVLDVLDGSGAIVGDRRIGFGDAFSVDGSRSSDIGGQVVEYRWVLSDGRSVTTDDPRLAVTDFMRFALGPHTFALTVVDSSGNESAVVETTVVVVDTQAPTAVLEVLDATGAVDADQRFGPGDVFSLSGSRSTDGEGSIAQYRWVLPDGQAVTTDSPTLAVTELTDAGFAVGEHTFGLRVVDESGNESSLAEVVVTIVDTQAPTAVLDVLDALGDIDADGRVEIGEDFSLSGARSVDTGGQLVRYDWILPSGLTVITDTPTLEVTLISDSGFGVGTHTFGLRVTDGSGNVSQLVQTTVTVVDTQSPTAVLEVVNAAGDVDAERSFRLGETFSLRGSRSVDVGGQITRYRWILPSGQSVVTETPTLAVTDLFGGSLEVGVSTFGLQVTDDSGNESTLAQVTVTLLEPDTTAPTAVLSAVYPDGRPVIGTVPQGAAFLLTGVRSTDVGGVIVRYDWRLPNGQVVTTDRPSLAVTEVAGPFGSGEQTFGLTVTDDSGNESVLAQVRVIIGL